MPVQQQMSSFAKQLGGRVAQANAEHKDKPIDTGNRRLPSGIRNGIAKLSTMYTSEYKDGDNKGKVFFRASAIVVSPEEHNGEKIAGLVTSVMIPLCDIPAKGQRKAKSFSENWFEFQNIFKLLSNGAIVCNETPETDPTGQRTEAFYMAAMKSMTDPVRMKTNPVYISFSTRGWTPPATPQNPKPDEMVFEDWHGLAQYTNGQPDPAAGVREMPPTAPPSYNGPPTQMADGLPPGAPPAPPAEVPHSLAEPQDEADQADAVAALVETAMNDPEGATEEGAAASSELEKLAWANGWTPEQTGAAADWAAVGEMALNAPAASTEPPTAVSVSRGGMTVNVGSKWRFAKRTKDGAKLKNNKGEEFPPQDVEVVTVDHTNNTCTVKTVKDGKSVIDIRSKQPVAVKFEWLE